MAWESRKGRGRYFTMSGRVNGRVTRTYYGAGALGEAAEAVYAMRRAQRQARSAARRADQQRWGGAERPTLAMIAALDRLIDATLLSAGFYRHSGEWHLRPGPRLTGSS